MPHGREDMMQEDGDTQRQSGTANISFGTVEETEYRMHPLFLSLPFFH